MGGTDEDDNIVELTAREHFIVHKLLTEIYPNENKLHYAAFLMAKMKDVHGRDYRVGSREYQRLKENIVLDEEIRRKIGRGVRKAGKADYWRNKQLSDSHKKNISDGMINKVRTRTHCKNLSKGVIQYDMDKNYINEFESIKSAGEFNNLFPQNISAVLRGVSSNCGGYLWKYKKT
jgi:hypothetical protein